MFVIKKETKKTLFFYINAFILPILILIWVLKLWGRDLSIPFAYGGDTLAASVLVKSIIDNGWFLHNSYLGTPFALDWRDYPLTDSFNFFLIKILSIFSPLSLSGYSLVLNLFFILVFSLITITSFYVFKQLKVSNGLALVFSVLYAFQPYHIYRGVGHLFLSAYYMVPLATLIVLWLWSDGSIFFAKDEKTGLYKLNLRNHRVIFTFVVCIIAGSTGIYYAFFSCFFVIVAGFSKFLKEKVKYSILSSVIVATLISSSVLLNAAPSLIYWYEHGSNPVIAARQPSEADVYGLKTVQLILPVPHHRMPLLRDIRVKYTAANFPLTTENSYTSLGIIGSLGFLGLLILLLFRPSNLNYYSEVLNHLASLNLSGILLATIGGLGSLFNVFVSPQIRAYNRISIFIAFFSLLAVAIFIQKNITQYGLLKKRTISFLLVCLLTIGILDQTPEVIFEFSYKQIKEQFSNDRTFVKEVESQLPPNSMVFQMPYVGFPEAPSASPNQPDAYAFFRGYLHSSNLKWSFGAMQGRNDNWHLWLSQKPLDELLTIIAAAGFKGIHIDRKSYLDMGNQIEVELKQKLGVEPIVSLNGDFIFFNMEKFNATYRTKYSEQERQVHREAALKAPVVKLEWGEGFFPLESDTLSTWRWADKTAILEFTNPRKTSKNVTLDMFLRTGESGKSNLLLQGDLFNENIVISEELSKFTKTISVPPGKHTIKFISDAKQVISDDTRSLFFTVMNFSSIENNGVNFKEISKSLADSAK